MKAEALNTLDRTSHIPALMLKAFPWCKRKKAKRAESVFILMAYCM